VSRIEPRKVAGYVIVAFLLGVLVIQYLVALPSAADDDRLSACRALSPTPFNHALGKLPATAPAFEAEDYTGKKATLAAYRGKVVFLNFWQTACAPCREEMPSMERLNQEMRGEDFVILALSSDPTWQTVRAFFPAGTQMTILLDPPAEAQSLGRIAQQYGTEHWPDSYLIDKQGRVRYYFVNRRSWDTANAMNCVSALLAE
jgi:peroxiredoxin